MSKKWYSSFRPNYRHFNFNPEVCLSWFSGNYLSTLSTAHPERLILRTYGCKMVASRDDALYESVEAFVAPR